MRSSSRPNARVDSDGTPVEHRFPGIGPEVPGAFEGRRERQGAGVRRILLTKRHGGLPRDAVTPREARGLRFLGVNDNPDQTAWTGSRKVFGHALIDDVAVGCPLVPATASGKQFRAVVDAPAVMSLLCEGPEHA